MDRTRLIGLSLIAAAFVVAASQLPGGGERSFLSPEQDWGVAVASSWTYDTEVERYPPRSLDELALPYTNDGWKLVQEPELPGPYRHAVGAHSPGPRAMNAESRWNNGLHSIAYRFRVKPEVSQLIVGIETMDGKLTVAVFEKPNDDPAQP